MAENEYQEEGATEIDFVMRNYEYANMAADMGQCRFGFATDIKAVCAKGDSGATVYKFLKDASGSSNTASTRILFADANGAASSHASLTFDGTTLKIAGALRKAGESVNNLTLGAAGLVTLGGNLALGANYLNYDGTANKGVVFTSSQQLIIDNTDSIILGDAKQMVSIRENKGNGNKGNGAGISFHGSDSSSATRLFGGIKAYKENSTTGNYDASVYIQTRANGSNPANALRLDSSQNGYIKNKLMVGSLTETPTVNLAVYADDDSACLLSVGNAFSGPNAGLVIGVDTAVGTNGTPVSGQCVIRADGYGKDIYVQSETATPNVFDTFIACEKLNAYSDYKTVTIADKLVVDGEIECEDMTALNDCIVQRRLSSYGDSDTYFDFSTDDQAVLNVGGVPFLTVVEADSAAIGTLGGNLALGANTISRDGSAGKGFGVNAEGIPTVTATVDIGGDVRSVLKLYDDTPFEEGDGAGIALFGRYSSGGAYAVLGGIKVSKENGVSGDNAASFYIQTRKQGSNPANALRLDSDQNGYIKNKLMVGSLTKTPENQLSVYSPFTTDTFIQVENGATGDGLIVGVEANGNAVLRVDYDKYLKFQSGSYSGPIDVATLRYGYAPTRFNVNGEIECDTFRLDQDPTAGSITPDKYIIINCNGTDYKIPVVAA